MRTQLMRRQIARIEADVVEAEVVVDGLGDLVREAFHVQLRKRGIGNFDQHAIVFTLLASLFFLGLQFGAVEDIFQGGGNDRRKLAHLHQFVVVEAPGGRLYEFDTAQKQTASLQRQQAVSLQPAVWRQSGALRVIAPEYAAAALQHLSRAENQNCRGIPEVYGFKAGGAFSLVRKIMQAGLLCVRIRQKQVDLVEAGNGPGAVLEQLQNIGDFPLEKQCLRQGKQRILPRGSGVRCYRTGWFKHSLATLVVSCILSSTYFDRYMIIDLWK